MKHRFTVITAIFVVLLLTLSSCHKNKNSKEEKPFLFPSFRLGIQQGESTIEYKAAQLFQRKVDELSQGTISIKIFPNGMLGDDITMVENVMNGSLDITYTETGRLGMWVKEAEIFGYPFAFDDFNHLKRTLESDYGLYLKSKFYEKNVIILATGYNGTRQTTSNKEIHSITDMKKLRFRVPNAYANTMFATLCGATAMTVPFNEVYRQLKSDLIDAQENPLPTIYANKLYEVQSSIALTSHIINDCNIIISSESYDRLSEWQQDALKEAAIIAADFLSESFANEEKFLLNFFESQGLTITTPDRSAFKKALIPLYDEYIKVYGDRAYKAIISAQKKE